MLISPCDQIVMTWSSERLYIKKGQKYGANSSANDRGQVCGLFTGHRPYRLDTPSVLPPNKPLNTNTEVLCILRLCRSALFLSVFVGTLTLNDVLVCIIFFHWKHEHTEFARTNLVSITPFSDVNKWCACGKHDRVVMVSGNTGTVICCFMFWICSTKHLLLLLILGATLNCRP